MTLYADFASQGYFRDPAAAIEKLRAMGPVVEVRFPIIGRIWTTTTEALATNHRPYPVHHKSRNSSVLALASTQRICGNGANRLQPTKIRPTRRRRSDSAENFCAASPNHLGA